MGGALPLIALTAGACVVLLVGLARSAFIRRQVVPVLTLVTLGVTAGLAIWQWDVSESIIADALVIDNLSLALMFIFLAGGFAAVFLAWRSVAAAEAGEGEFYALLLTSILGMVVLVAANDLVVLFIGFELLSIPLYVLCATHMKREQSLESGLKYLIIGSVGSATLLYGLALLYGVGGRDQLRGARRRGPGDGRRRAVPDRRRAGDGRAGVQGLGRAVPPVDARRLRGRADARDRLHGRRHQGRRVRRHPAALRRRADLRPRRPGRPRSRPWP